MSHGDRKWAMLKEKEISLFVVLSYQPLPRSIPSIMNPMLADLQVSLKEFAKSMPDCGMAKDGDFKVWGQGFCERMVSHHAFEHPHTNHDGLGKIQ
jgi:hypothetical protein